MAEADLTRKILVHLKNTYPGVWIKVAAGPFQVTGLPDIVGCYQGRFVAFEVKLPGKEKTLTLRQKRMLDAIKKSGGIASMITSVDEALEVLKLG